MKEIVGEIEPIPNKRIFYSIIADYNLSRAVCELVDNALDQWTKSGRKADLTVEMDFDLGQQTIRVVDNAGGVLKDDLEILVGPGLTTNAPEDTTIGIFGVGTKRAVVALAEDVEIRSRRGSSQTYQIEFNDSWLKDDSWKLPVYQVDAIDPSSTEIDLSRLRFHIKKDHVDRLVEHVGATYALFLGGGKVLIKINGDPVSPIVFENWAFPPKFGPRRFVGSLDVGGKSVAVEVIAGLAKESSPAGGEYGVYWYCNRRLVGRAVKSHHVGFVRGLAGLPHPKVSLVRAIVMMEGEARLMPWNSTKSGLSYEHPVFLAMREWLVNVVKEYAALSRGWMGAWPDQVFRYETGSITKVPVKDFTAARTYFPSFPKFRPRFADKVRAENEKTFADKPWSRGVSEGIVAVDLISKANLEQRNRIALIILDSTLEIAFKEFLVNDSGQYYSDAQVLQLFKTRNLVHEEIKKYKTFPDALWKRINYYYNLRCKLVHERATVPISGPDIEVFRSIVEKMTKALFGVKFP